MQTSSERSSRWRAVAAALALGWRASPARLASLVLVSIGRGVLPVGAAWLTKALFDELSAGPAAAGGRVAWTAVAIASVGLLAVVSGPIDDYIGTVLRRAITVTVQDRLFARVNRFAGLAYFESPALQDQLQLAQDAGRRAPQQVIDSALRLVPAVIQLVGYCASILVIWPPMLGILALAALPMLLVELTLSRRRTALTEDLTPTERRQFFYQGLLVDVRAAKEIRLFGAGAFLHARMLTALRTAVSAENALDRRTVLLQGGLAVLGGLLTGTVLVVTAHAALAGTLSLGDVALFLAAVGGAQTGALMTIGEVAVAYGSLTLFRHYLAVVNAGDDLAQGTARPRWLRDGIELRDVWFRYSEDQPWILRGVNLHIPAGSTVGLVGVNGAGKSTLVKLLCRFYDPQRGQILWDGVDVRELSCGALRNRIAAVFQDYMCYDLTARENIAMGQLDALHDDGRIRAAARLAEADEAIADLPRGYETMLSRIFFGEDEDQGVVLSGGQWQRLALARSALREDCDLVILDEPSSGLDPEAEYRVQRTLREQRRGTANLLISHRLNTLRDADQIAVLAGGEVIELGAHDELMAAQGEYARLFLMQASGYRDPVDLAADGAGVAG